MSKWIKKDDTVLVTTGNEKGRTGKVLSRQGEKVVIQGLNIRKKHVKRRSKVPTPEVMELEMPMHISNVKVCNEDGKALELKMRTGKNGKKDLVYLEGKKEVVYRELRKEGK